MTNYRVLFLLPLVALFGCGGGSGDGGSGGPVASTHSFNILQAYINDFQSAYSKSFSVSGTISGYNVTGSGNLTVGTFSGGISFEGQQAFQRTTTVTGTVSANGQSFPLNSSVFSYTDTNFLPLGSSAGDEYISLQAPHNYRLQHV